MDDKPPKQRSARHEEHRRRIRASLGLSVEPAAAPKAGISEATAAPAVHATSARASVIVSNHDTSFASASGSSLAAPPPLHPSAASAHRGREDAAVAHVDIPGKRRASSPLRRVSTAMDGDEFYRRVRPHIAQPLPPVAETSPAPDARPAAAPLARAASISSVAATAATGGTDGSAIQRSKTFQYVEVVRGKEARRALHGYDCACCKDFYASVNNFPLARAQSSAGLGRAPILPPAPAAASSAAPRGERVSLGAALVREATAIASRHRARFSPAHTPEGYWALDSMPDQDDLPIMPFNRHELNR